MSTPRVRADLSAIPTYRPGRAAPGGEQGRSYKCSSNENPFSPLPGVLAAVAAAAEHLNRYPDLTTARLVAALAERLDVPADDIVTGPGSVGVLQALVAAVAGPGDEVLFAWRSFEAYPIVTQVAGATPVAVPLTPDHRHDVTAMAAAVTDRTRLVLVCSPNNPTGTVVGAAELDRLLQQVPDDVLVVVDEAYREMVRDPRAADGLAAYRERTNVGVLRTFSKAYGLAGLRVGYAVAPEPMATAVRRTSLPFGVSSVAEAAAVASLGHEPALLDRVEALVAERARVQRTLAEQGWAVPASEANFVWFDLRDRAEAFAAACAQAGLVVRAFPGAGVRVTVAEAQANDLLLAVTASLSPADAADLVARPSASR